MELSQVGKGRDAFPLDVVGLRGKQHFSLGVPGFTPAIKWPDFAFACCYLHGTWECGKQWRLEHWREQAEEGTLECWQAWGAGVWFRQMPWAWQIQTDKQSPES